MFTDISLPQGLQLRELTSQDQLFTEALFYSTRQFLYQAPMAKAQVDVLIKQQFLFQQSSYATSYPDAHTLIIQCLAVPVGKIVVNRSREYLHIVDIAFVVSARGKGYGTAVLRALKQMASQLALPLRLSVDQYNIRAKKLYSTLGFTLIESSETHDILLW